MNATIRLVMLTAVHDRLFGLFFGLLAVSTALSVVLGSAMVIEQSQAAIVFGAGAGRMILIIGLTIFAAFHIQHLIESRELEAILARAISRQRFVLAYWLGLSGLVIILAGAFGVTIALIDGATSAAFMWAASLILECIIVQSVVLFAGLMLERATPTVLFTLGFYVLTRLMGYFIGIRDTATDSLVTVLAKRGLDVVMLLVPRLDLFTQSRWLVYADAPIDLGFLAVQTVLFPAMVLVAAMFDLGRKQF